MKNILIFLLLFTLKSAFATCANGIDTSFLVSLEKVEILCKSRFTIAFSESKKAPVWAIEVLRADDLHRPEVKRANNFKKDPAVRQQNQANLSAFQHTIYDKGHLVPFENVADSQLAADESFLMTNILVQNSAHNRGIWRALESRIRKMAEENGQLIIATGGIFNDSAALLDGTRIPTDLWKIIIIPGQSIPLIYVIPNIGTLKAVNLNQFRFTVESFQKINGHVKFIKVAKKR